MEIPDDKLFRIVKLTKGQFEGQYKIYWNSYICQQFETNRNIYKWGDKEILQAEAGDYVETYDGTCMQILDIRIYPDKKERVFHFVRFPTATTYFYFTKFKELKFRQLQGNFMTAGRNNMRMNTHGGSANQKVRFVSYLVAGIHPFKAYRLAMGNYSTLTVTNLHKRINQMAQDEIVKKELLIQLNPLIDKVQNKFSDERMVTELGELLDKSRKGSGDHRENIKFILSLMDKLPENMKERKNKNLKDVQEVPYDEVTPPEFGK